MAKVALPTALLHHSARTDLGPREPHRDRRQPFTFSSSRARVAFFDQYGISPDRTAVLVDAVDCHFDLDARYRRGRTHAAATPNRLAEHAHRADE